MDVQGKSAFVTGSASGIGRVSALALARKGATHVTLCDLDGDGMAATADLIRPHGTTVEIRKFSVTDSEALGLALAETHARHGLDILLNNAGIVSGPPYFPETPAKRVKIVVDVNLTAVIVGTIAAIELMKRAGGVIINTASAGALYPVLSDATYCATKAGVLTFTQACKELRDTHGIRVNAILPGVVETPILEKIGGGSRPDWFQARLNSIEMIQPEEIARRLIEELIEDDTKAGDFILATNSPIPGKLV